jgi:large subunit ribosomal protein L28e
VKRNHSGSVQFSRDPYNLTNKHSRKHAGFVNDKAVAIAEHNGGIRLHTKKNKASYKPGSHNNTHTFGAGASSRA